MGKTEKRDLGGMRGLGKCVCFGEGNGVGISENLGGHIGWG